MIALLIAAATSMAVSLLGTRALITFFRNRGKGQPILGKEDRGPDHEHKQGTPTMGGLAIVVAAFIGYLVAHALRRITHVTFSNQALWMFFGIFVMAGLGFLDDFIKVRRQRNRGVFWKLKGWITLAVSGAIATPLVLVEHVNTHLSFTRYSVPGWNLHVVGWIVLATLVIFSTSNAVNVTDGLDGLAGGSALFGFFAFTVIAFWNFRNPITYGVGAGGTINPLDLAIVAVAFAGGSLGFLWWNAAPARIFMGDVGALGLGTALAFLALATNTHLLLPIICGLNVMEIGSVALQMAVYKSSGRTRRLFKLSPVHHHFELSGWPETTVIIRFWIISGIFVAVALGVFYADFARFNGVLG